MAFLNHGVFVNLG